VLPAQLGQSATADRTQTALAILEDLFDHLSQFRVFSIRLVSFSQAQSAADTSSTSHIKEIGFGLCVVSVILLRAERE
jgi:hypothetical protein